MAIDYKRPLRGIRLLPEQKFAMEQAFEDKFRQFMEAFMPHMAECHHGSGNKVIPLAPEDVREQLQSALTEYFEYRTQFMSVIRAADAKKGKEASTFDPFPKKWPKPFSDAFDETMPGKPLEQSTRNMFTVLGGLLDEKSGGGEPLIARALSTVDDAIAETLPLPVRAR